MSNEDLLKAFDAMAGINGGTSEDAEVIFHKVVQDKIKTMLGQDADDDDVSDESADSSETN